MYAQCNVFLHVYIENKANKIKGTIKNGQSRDNGDIGQPRVKLGINPE